MKNDFRVRSAKLVVPSSSDIKTTYAAIIAKTLYHVKELIQS
jgi:hypothetical protein